MTLIKSISGIRGTIGGNTGDNLTPIDAVKFAAAYGMWLKNNSKKGMVVSKDVGGLTLVASWVRTDSFTHDTDIFIDDEE